MPVPATKLITKQDLQTPEARALLEELILWYLSANPHITHIALDELVAEYRTDLYATSHNDSDLIGDTFSADLCLIKRPSKKDENIPRYDIYSTNDLLGAGVFGAIYEVALETKATPAGFSYRQPPKVAKYLQKPDDITLADWKTGIKEETSIFKDIYDGKAHCSFAGETATVVMKKLQGDNLEDLLKKVDLNFAEMIIIANRIVDGLMDIHAKNYVHADVKPPNVMIERKQRKAAWMDFGFAMKVNTCGKPSGSPAYAAEELFLNPFVEYTIALDKYSLAGLLAELFKVEDPFKNKFIRDRINIAPYCFDGLLDNIAGAEPYKAEIKKMLESLSHKNPKQRMALLEVKEILNRIEKECLILSAKELTHCAASIQKDLSELLVKKNIKSKKHRFMQHIFNHLDHAIHSIAQQDDLTWETYEKAYQTVRVCIQNMENNKKALGAFRGLSPYRVFNTLTRPISMLLGWLCNNEKWTEQGFVYTTSLKIAIEAKQSVMNFHQTFFKHFSSQANFECQPDALNIKAALSA